MLSAKRTKKLAWIWCLFFGSFHALARPIHYLTGCPNHATCCVAILPEQTSCCGHTCGVRSHRDSHHAESENRKSSCPIAKSPYVGKPTDKKTLNEPQLSVPMGEHYCHLCEQLSVPVVPLPQAVINLYSTQNSQLELLSFDRFVEQSRTLPEARGPPR